MSLPKPTIRVVLEGGRVKSVHSEIPVTCEVINRDDFNKPDRCFESFHAKEVPVAPCLKDSLLGREYRLFKTYGDFLRAVLFDKLDTCTAGPTKDLDGLFPPRMSLSEHRGWVLVTEVYASERPLAQRNPTWLHVYKGSVTDFSSGPDAARKVTFDRQFARALEGLFVVKDLGGVIPTTLIEEIARAVEADTGAWKAAIAELVKQPRYTNFPLPVKMVTLSGTPAALVVHSLEVRPDTEGDHAEAAELLQTDNFDELLESEKQDPEFAKNFEEAEAAAGDPMSAEDFAAEDFAAEDFAAAVELSPEAVTDLREIKADMEPKVAETTAPKKTAKKNAKKATEPKNESAPAD